MSELLQQHILLDLIDTGRLVPVHEVLAISCRAQALHLAPQQTEILTAVGAGLTQWYFNLEQYAPRDKCPECRLLAFWAFVFDCILP